MSKNPPVICAYGIDDRPCKDCKNYRETNDEIPCRYCHHRKSCYFEQKEREEE